MVMTRTECEREIFERLMDIVDIYHKYNPDGEYLSLTYCTSESDEETACEYISFNNRHWEFDDPEMEDGEDKDTPIDFFLKLEGKNDT